jgi:hypothetical protein
MSADPTDKKGQQWKLAADTERENKLLTLKIPDWREHMRCGSWP